MPVIMATVFVAKRLQQRNSRACKTRSSKCLDDGAVMHIRFIRTVALSFPRILTELVLFDMTVQYISMRSDC